MSPGPAGGPSAQSEKTKATIKRLEEEICSNWNIPTYQDAFPISIRPASMGLSALANLRIISRVPLPSAQTMFLSVCKGTATFGFSHTIAILKQIRGSENSASAPNTPKTGEKPKPAKTAKENVRPSPASVNGKAVSGPAGLPAKPPSVVSPGSAVNTPTTYNRAPQAPMTAYNAQQIYGGQLGPQAATQVPPTRIAKRDHQEFGTPTSGPYQYSDVPDAKKARSDLGLNELRSPQLHTPVSDNGDDLDRKMAEHQRGSAAFFAGAAARQAVFNQDPVRVPPATQFPDDYDPFKEHCLGLHETFSAICPSKHVLQRMARPDQAPMVEEVYNLLDRSVRKLQQEMAAIFAAERAA